MIKIRSINQLEEIFGEREKDDEEETSGNTNQGDEGESEKAASQDSKSNNKKWKEVSRGKRAILDQFTRKNGKNT